jgi:hypothetical protein
MRHTYYSNAIKCRAEAGTVLPSQAWTAGEPVRFIFCPKGINTITAGFRDGSITITVDVDTDTPRMLQAAFDEMVRGTSQEPYGDEDHQNHKATIRFPAGRTRFTWGTIRSVEGVVVEGGIPTSYGAESVNGRVFRSWSPEFTTDADFSQAVCKDGHWTFPDYVRGSESNPARMTGVNFVVGALTNKPAFRAMPAVKARHAGRSGEDVLAELAARRDAAERICDAAVLKSFQDL